MLRIAHIINPVSAPLGSELSTIQPITFEAMRLAVEFSKNIVAVELYTTQFPEDHTVIPSYFEVLPDLKRSVQDEANFAAKKKLPFIHDILQTLQQNSEADYFIYTNMDIIPMPHFYSFIANKLAAGHDALLITRRRISKRYNDVSQLSEIFSDIGQSHPGYDCFVFKRELLEQFVLGKICIGIPFLEVSLLHNLVAFSKRLALYDNQHLTAHIGMEVMPPVDAELYWRNRKEYETNIRPQLKPHLNLLQFPYSNLPFYKRLLTWGLNPCYSTALMLEIEGKNRKRKLKFYLDEIRFRILDQKKN